MKKNEEWTAGADSENLVSRSNMFFLCEMCEIENKNIYIIMNKLI